MEETVLTIVAILVATAGVYYSRKQSITPRRDRLNSDEVLSNESRSVLDKIQSSKLLRVGCLWYPPFVEYKIVRNSIEASGFYPDILTALAKSQGIRVQFSVLKWHEAIDALGCRDVDIVACVLKSAERRASCDFAGTIFRIGVGAVVQSEQIKIKDHGDLARDDVSIAVTKGEIGWTYATENLELTANPVRFTVFEDTNIQTMMALVEKGTVDCALADSLSCAQFIEASNDGAQPLLDIFATNPIHVEDNSLMIAKDNRDLADWLESGINALRTLPAIKLREQEIETMYPGILHRAGPRE